MKIFPAPQIRELDAFTINEKAITSLELMERAARCFCRWFVQGFPSIDTPIVLFCGPGNNGGDGLAVGRLLQEQFYTVTIYDCQVSKKHTTDFEQNLARLPLRKGLKYFQIKKEDAFPNLPNEAIVIDALFGSGLNRPIEGYWGALIEYLNTLSNTRVSIDIPSGLFADQHSEGNIFKADYTLSFEMPKLAFLFPENHQWVGKWEFVSIGLSQNFIQKTNIQQFYLTGDWVRSRLKKRDKYDHKGTNGKNLFICGSYGMAGAAILAAEACLRTGAGLVSIHSPKRNNDILQIAIPEAMISLDKAEDYFSAFPNLEPYSALGIGCGLGRSELSKQAIQQHLASISIPLVLDADALNLIAEIKNGLELIPKGSIITPHPKEFERLFGNSGNDFERHTVQIKYAKQLGIYILLKGAHTCIACPDGSVYFNSTGNPGMATAGSGDVLTGMITALLGQGYPAKEAALIAAFLHGLAGDFAAKAKGEVSMLARDIIQSIAVAFQYLQKKELVK